MARYQRSEPVYEIFKTFEQRSLQDDRSLIWEDRAAWTKENLEDIKARLLDAPFHGKRSFIEKLAEQMEGASPDLWALIADIFYIYFLPSSHFKLETKYSRIKRCAQSGGLLPPPSDAPIWSPQKAGFTRTSFGYHKKISQFRLLILFALHIKSQENRRAILESSAKLQDVLDGIIESIPKSLGRAYDMRHAILHMAFPDEYERIISNQDKQSIINTYRKQLEYTVPTDPDQAIRAIRETLIQTYGKVDQSFDFYDDVRSEWRPGEHESANSGITEDDNDTQRALKVLGNTRNIILYGPPGTGKTYIARKVAETLIINQLEQVLPEAMLHQQAVDGLTFYEILALSMYIGNKGKYIVPEIGSQPLVQARFRVMPVKHPNNQIWNYLQSHTGLDSKTVRMANRAEPYLFDKDETSQWYLTEMGRDFVEQNLADSANLIKGHRSEKPKPADFIRLVTFHQSYAYEDFIEGLRPVTSEDDPGSVSYEIVPGVFRLICNQAAADSKNKYVLIIDEINRGNIAKIFGELITLIEDDKRAGALNALTVTLPHNRDVFSVPNNLYIIGTMNTADRSIALLDVALRRRFAFVEMVPRPDLLRGIRVESDEADIPLQDVLVALNKEIATMRGCDYQLGHSYFLKVADTEPKQRLSVLEFVWNHQILPLLEEYFYSYPDQLAEILSPFRMDSDEELGFGEIPLETFDIPYLTGDDLLSTLNILIDRESNEK